jgi:hypothetical protein
MLFRESISCLRFIHDLHVYFSFLFIDSPELLHLNLLPGSLFDFLEFVVIVEILSW